MLFASNEHGLFPHTTRFAFLSQAQLCQQSGSCPALLRLSRCMPSKSWHLFGERIQGWWGKTLWDHRVTLNLLVAASPLHEPHAEFPRPWGWGVCLQKLSHLQSQTVYRGNVMTKFWVYVLFFVQKRFWEELSRSVECSLGVTNSSLLMTEPLSQRFEDVSSTDPTTHLT